MTQAMALGIALDNLLKNFSGKTIVIHKTGKRAADRKLVLSAIVSDCFFDKNDSGNICFVLSGTHLADKLWVRISCLKTGDKSQTCIRTEKNGLEGNIEGVFSVHIK